MTGPRVSVLRISTVPLALITGIFGVFTLAVWLVDPLDPWFMFVVPWVMFSGVQLAAAASLVRAVGRFSEIVDQAGAGSPEVRAGRDGDVVAHWPAWALTVGGTISRMVVRTFGFQVGGERFPLRLRGAEQGARAALHLVGRGGGVVGDHDGTVPAGLGVGPFLGVLVGGLVAWALGDLLVSWWVGAFLGVAVACAALSALLVGHAVHRQELRGFLARLQARGVRVDRPIRLWDGFSPRFVVPTSEGAYLIGWLSLWRRRRLFVSRGGVDLPPAVYASAQ